MKISSLLWNQGLALAIACTLNLYSACAFSPSSCTPGRTRPVTSSALQVSSYLDSLSRNANNKINVITPSPQPIQQPVISSNTCRTTIVAGNWKLNPSNRAEAINLLNGLKAGRQSHNSDDVEVVIFPPMPFLQDALSILQGTNIKIGAQTASSYEQGAYTGEVSPSMLASVGCSYVLLGHSERRTVFGEDDTSINEKVKTCLKESNLKVILCIGETLQEYEAGLLQKVIDTQLRKGLEGVSAQDLLNDRLVIAYEPVWAIGTGLVATPDQAQAAHLAIRNTLHSMYFHTPNVKAHVRIQYGGSVKPDSVKDLMNMPDVDGALVGGASLDAASFTQIIIGSSKKEPTALTPPTSLQTPLTVGNQPNHFTRSSKVKTGARKNLKWL